MLTAVGSVTDRSIPADKVIQSMKRYPAWIITGEQDAMVDPDILPEQFILPDSGHYGFKKSHWKVINTSLHDALYYFSDDPFFLHEQLHVIARKKVENHLQPISTDALFQYMLQANTNTLISSVIPESLTASEQNTLVAVANKFIDSRFQKEQSQVEDGSKTFMYWKDQKIDEVVQQFYPDSLGKANEGDNVAPELVRIYLEHIEMLRRVLLIGNEYFHTTTTRSPH